MTEKIEFNDRHQTQQELSGLREQVTEWRNESKFPVEGEIEKTAETLHIIDVINQMIEKELKATGIEDFEPIEAESVHILPDAHYEDLFPGDTADGFFRSTSDVVFVRESKLDTSAKMFALLIHELVHRASKQRFHFDPETKNISDARMGYRLNSQWKSPERVHRFRGFNELMVDFTTLRVMAGSLGQLEQEFSMTKEDVNGPIYSYMKDGDLISVLITGIAKSENMTTREAFEKLERGQFTSLLVLRSVEKAFGKGSVDMLSLFGVIDGEKGQSLNKIVKGFFASQDTVEREELSVSAHELVDEYFCQDDLPLPS